MNGNPVLIAFALGAVSQVSLILSALAVYVVKIPTRVVGALAAFGAGALVAAVARDLLPEAHVLSVPLASLWAMGGAVTFMVGQHLIEKKFGSGSVGGALGIVIGAIVDGIPESIIFGIQLASGAPISFAFIAAVFVSNIPQAVAPSAELAATGWNWRRVVGLWSWVVIACGIASVLGYGAGSANHLVTGTGMAAFAGGGILAMLSNSLIPFAHERSKAAGLWTVLGFCASFAMTG